MRGSLGSLLILVGLGFASTANAQVTDPSQCGTTLPACTTQRTSCCTRNFEGTATNKAILIPTDRCHQRIAAGGANAPASGPSATLAPNWCSMTGTTNSNAMNRAYGLVYRLMQNHIPVYWVVNPTKSASVNIVNVNNTNPATTPDARTKDVDFWILSATGSTPTPTGAFTSLSGTAPIKRLQLNSPGTVSANFTTAATYTYNEFAVRGGAFIISPDDRAAFNTFHTTQLGRTCGTSGQDCYDFRDVNFYEIDPSAVLVWQDYTQPLSGGKYVQRTKEVPVAMKIDYEPPRVSAVDGNLLTNFLAAANLDDLDSGAGCTGPSVITNKRVGCKMTEANIQANKLVTDNFNWLWLDGPNSSASCTLTTAKIRSFLTATVGSYTAGNAIFFNAALDTFAENCTGDKGFLGNNATGLGITNGAVNETSSNPVVVRYPTNLLSQYGDLDLDFASGTVSSWNRVSGTTDLYNAAYNTAPITLKRLMTKENTSGTDCANHMDIGIVGAASTAGCDDAAMNTTSADILDLFAYGRYQNVAINGVIFYSPGNNLTPAGQQAQLKMVLSSLIALPPFIIDQTFNSLEVTRSSPVIATVEYETVTSQQLIQGSYVYKYDIGLDFVKRIVPQNVPGVFLPADIDSFTFPSRQGHLHSITTASITSTTAGTLAAGTSVFDAGASTTIPTVTTNCTAFDLSCRNIWTNTSSGFGPYNPVEVGAATAATVGPLMLPNTASVTYSGTDYTNFVARIRAGWDPNFTGTRVAQMGGIDRSTPAVIGPNSSSASRPTVAYVGADDGMLHAICASSTAGCTAGQELWAFIPRTNLGLLRYNTARIDSSPKVLDVRADFDGTGASIYTVLIFSAGGDPTTEDQVPAVYALDVTNPDAPRLLWEYDSWDSSGTGTVFPAALTRACPTANKCEIATYTSTASTAKTPSSRGTYSMGVGIDIVAGQATIGGSSKNVVIAVTNNGGTGSAANVVTMLDLDNGGRIWQRVNKLDMNLGTRPATTNSVPSSAVPPGAVPVDKTTSGSNGFMTDIVVGDVYGEVWVLDPADGTSQVANAGTDVPIFSYNTDFHPIARPAIYSESGIQYAIWGTGGYTDYSGTTGWGKNTTTQYLTAVNLNYTSGATLNEGSIAANVPIQISFTDQGRVFSQPRVVGTQVFVTTDVDDYNQETYGSRAAPVGVTESTAQCGGATATGNNLDEDSDGFKDDGCPTGRVFVYDLSANTYQKTVVSNGGSSVINSGTKIIVSGGGTRQVLGSDGGVDVNGDSVNDAAGTQWNAMNQTGERTIAPAQVTQTIRELWLRTE